MSVHLVALLSTLMLLPHLANCDVNTTYPPDLSTDTDTDNDNDNDDMFVGLDQPSDYYRLPKLPYTYEDLEPWLDTRSVEDHHAGQLAGYVGQLNRLLKEWRSTGEEHELATSSLINILRHVDKIPEKWRRDIRNAAGGYVNHIFFFSTLHPNPNNVEQPMPLTLLRIFRRSFHNYTDFRIWFSREALTLHGSGFVWLCRVPEQEYLTVYRTDNNVSPVSLGLQPLLGLDMWEHAYYMMHQHRKKDYIESWWNLVNWEKVERLLDWWLSEPQPHDEL